MESLRQSRESRMWRPAQASASATVSRVLNGRANVRPDTRAKVLEAIDALEYRPSPIARNLSLRRTHVIGVVVPFFTSASAVERVRGVATAARSLALRPHALRHRGGGAARARLPALRPWRPLRRPLADLPDPARRRSRTAARRTAAVRARRRPARGLPQHRDRRRSRGRHCDVAPHRARAQAHRVPRGHVARPIPVRIEPGSHAWVRAGARACRNRAATGVRARGNEEPPRRAEHRDRPAAPPAAADRDLRSVRHAGSRRARGGAHPRDPRAARNCRS